MSLIPTPVMNYMVPASSSPNAVIVRETFGIVPHIVNFNDTQLSGVPFRPSGVYVDNVSGDNSILMVINEISLTIVIPAGAFLAIPYPAPLNHTVSIYGQDDIATLVFVDFPVMPYSSAVGSGGAFPTEMSVNVLNAVASVPGNDTTGAQLPPEFTSAPATFTYSGGNIATESVTAEGYTWVRTYSWIGNELTSISGWVRQ